MTCIANFPTKKAFREAVQKNPLRVQIEDPSIVAPYWGSLDGYMRSNGACYVTNHPKRSWFACVTVKSDGTFRVD